MMRKFFVVLVAMLLLIPAAGTAETDLSAMTDEELVQLRDAANLELAARHPAEGPLATWEMEGCRIDVIAHIFTMPRLTFTRTAWNANGRLLTARIRPHSSPACSPAAPSTG